MDFKNQIKQLGERVTKLKNQINLKKAINLILSVILVIIFIPLSGKSQKQLYSNGSEFRVIRYIHTDVNGNVVNRNDNVKKTSFIIDNYKKILTVKMDAVYSEYFHYNKIERIKSNGNTRDVFSIYRSYSSENRDKTITDKIVLDIDASNNSLKSYILSGNGSSITFYLQPQN